jgi:hypothetical protein
VVCCTEVKRVCSTIPESFEGNREAKACHGAPTLIEIVQVAH